jgi:hypothetical protein
MPSDVSIGIVTQAERQPAPRMPIGLGLSLGAFASLALWTVIGFGLRALF